MNKIELIKEYQSFKREVNKLFCSGNYVHNIETITYQNEEYISVDILDVEKEKDDEDYEVDILINLNGKVEPNPYVIKGKEQELLDLLKS